MCLRVIRGPKGGRWYWRGEVYQDGKSRTVWTGWGTIEEADRAVAAIVARDGLTDPRPPRGLGAADTVRDLLETWLGSKRDRADLRPLTRRMHKVRARALIATLGGLPLDSLDFHALERHRDARLLAGIAPGTVAAELGILRCAWRWARLEDRAPERDLPRVDVRIRPKRERTTPTPGEVAAVVGRLEGWQRLAVVLLYGTGARMGEIASLTWDRVDLEAGEVTLHGKTGARIVPILPPVVQALSGAPRSGAAVLGVAHSTAVSHLERAIRQACEDAKIRPWTPQGLRRAACDALYRSGEDVGAAAALLGHSPAIALRYYRQATRDDVKKAAIRARLGTLPAGQVIDLQAAAGGGATRTTSENDPHNSGSTDGD